MDTLLLDASPQRVRDLNGAFRRSFAGGRVVLTAGVATLPCVARASLLAAVRSFAAFDTGNDPYCEHDFGVVAVGGVRGTSPPAASGSPTPSLLLRHPTSRRSCSMC